MTLRFDEPWYREWLRTRAFSRGREHAHRVLIEYDPTAEWHKEERSGVGVWSIYDDGDCDWLPVARALSVDDALQCASDLMQPAPTGVETLLQPTSEGGIHGRSQDH